ncbi:MAG: hypothetical protein KDE03_17190 [Rhodobacteraceae bacterium]|nr:hypothetical protein [Paracoccaceae bacterium]
MSWFARLFGGGTDAKQNVAPIDHNGFRIFAEPIKEGSGFRVAAMIEKDIDGETKQHRMVRADTVATAEGAAELTLHKARALIDQQGDAIFGGR